MCKTSRLTYLLALNVLFSVLETLYTAYYAIGFLAYFVALISHLPFIVSFLRMICRDTERRRHIFYRNCCKLWLISILVDLYVFFHLEPEVNESCETVHYLPDNEFMASAFNKTSVSDRTLILACSYAIFLDRTMNMIMQQLQYGLLVFISYLFWSEKH